VEIHDPSVLTNCLIYQNDSDELGTIYLTGSDSVFQNCTIVDNYNSGEHGGGLYLSNDSNPIVTDCILWGNLPDEIYVDSGAPAVTYTDV